jgi:hypothetical protein
VFNRMLITCSHLQPLERELREIGTPIEHEGQSWWGTSRGMWIYFRCFLEEGALRRRFNLPESVRYSEYDGGVAGQEAGFVCSECESAVVGVHRRYATDWGQSLPLALPPNIGMHPTAVQQVSYR